MEDLGHPVHYTAIERGVPVFSSDGIVVGKVEQVLDNYSEHIFDGVVLRNSAGELRFVDAPEVEHTAERGVLLAISAAQAEQLGPPEQGHGSFKPNRSGRLGRLLGGNWKRH